MRSFFSATKVAGRLILRSNGGKQLLGLSPKDGRLGQVRRLGGSFPVIGEFQVNNDICYNRDSNSLLGRGCNGNGNNGNGNAIQKRGFLGCGDGEEGNVLSKVYEERRVMGYSQEQLYAVVAAVDMYEDFLPWCQRSDIVRRFPDGSFDAELEIGFKFLVESYVSHVELIKPKSVKTTVSQSNLFDHLINVWEFSPGPVPGTCNIYFLVDFKFQSPLYRQMATMFFKEVVSRLVGSFHDRCRLIYGPGVTINENVYQQKT